MIQSFQITPISRSRTDFKYEAGIKNLYFRRKMRGDIKKALLIYRYLKQEHVKYLFKYHLFQQQKYKQRFTDLRESDCLHYIDDFIYELQKGKKLFRKQYLKILKKLIRIKYVLRIMFFYTKHAVFLILSSFKCNKEKIFS